jgi:hypothetical protein
MEWLKRLFKGSPEPEPEEPQVEPIEITLPDLPKGLYTNEDFKIFVEGVTEYEGEHLVIYRPFRTEDFQLMEVYEFSGRFLHADTVVTKVTMFRAY